MQTTHCLLQMPGMSSHVKQGSALANLVGLIDDIHSVVKEVVKDT